MVDWQARVRLGLLYQHLLLFLKLFLRIQLRTLPVYVSDVGHEINVAFVFHHRLGFLLFDTFLIRFA